MEYNIDQLDGVGPVTVKKLKEFGVTSLFDICVRGAREIAEITGTAKSKADTWVFNEQKIEPYFAPFYSYLLSRGGSGRGIFNWIGTMGTKKVSRLSARKSEP